MSGFYPSDTGTSGLFDLLDLLKRSRSQRSSSSDAQSVDTASDSTELVRTSQTLASRLREQEQLANLSSVPSIRVRGEARHDGAKDTYDFGYCDELTFVESVFCYLMRHPEDVNAQHVVVYMAQVSDTFKGRFGDFADSDTICSALQLQLSQYGNWRKVTARVSEAPVSARPNETGIIARVRDNDELDVRVYTLHP